MATASEMRTGAVNLMTSRKSLNSYTQGSDRVYFFGKPDNKPGNTTQKGYSDCSSAVRAAIKAASGIDIGSNTSAQINNRNTKGLVVHETTGYYPDESKLLPGDCIYFKGNTSHPLDVGHVEMYIGNGKCCGHGSGTGPKIRNMRDYCTSRANSKKRYFMAIRWIQDDVSGNEPEKLVLKKGMYDSAAVKDQIGDEEESALDPIPSANGVVIANGTWNVRTGPGTKYPSAGIVRGGDVLEKVELNGWMPVKANGEVVFIGPSAVKK